MRTISVGKPEGKGHSEEQCVGGSWYYNISQRNKIYKGCNGLTSIRTVQSGVSFEHYKPPRSLKCGKLLA